MSPAAKAKRKQKLRRHNNLKQRDLRLRRKNFFGEAALTKFKVKEISFLTGLKVKEIEDAYIFSVKGSISYITLRNFFDEIYEKGSASYRRYLDKYYYKKQNT